LAWPAWLQPFRSIVWPGTGPRLDLKRDWPELTVIALATLLFWRGAPVADAPNAVEAAGRGLFHPIFGLPAALLGVTGGARFALLAGLLVAAGGMWWLGVVLGLGRPARLWASLTYAFAGGVGAGWMAGRFGLDLGYPWIPWALACALLAVRWRRRLYTAGAAAALALILLGGDFGLTCTTVVVLALFLGVAGTGLRRERPYISLRRNEALIAALIGLLGLGLAAIQLLPQFAAALAGSLAADPMAIGGGLGRLLGSLSVQPPGQPAVNGLYVYLGLVPFLFLAGLPAAVRRENRRIVLGLGLLIAMVLLWAAGNWLGRSGASAAILAWGAVALLALAGLGFDALWRWAAANLKLRRVSVPAAVRWAAAWLGLIVLTALAAASVIDLYLKNRPASSASAVILPGFNAGELLRGEGAQHPVLLGVGAAMSILSLIGFLALIVGDVRRRRSRLETDAVYDNGVLRPAEPLDIPDGTSVRVVVAAEGLAEAEAEDKAEGEPVQTAAPARSTSTSSSALTSNMRLEWLLFALALLVYLFTRLYGITQFPIYFFADEATHAVYAQDLLDRGFKDGRGSVMPIYFEAAGNRWTPLLSVYVHAISVASFGKSIFVTRATSAVVSVLAALAVALILKLVFKSRYWWAGALLMAVAPAWFLHSRTGFETVMMSSFFACFLLCYLLYRTRSPRYLYAAILFGAATFYTYSNGQMIMAAAAVLLAISDFRYHLKHWRTVALGLLLVLLLAVPVLKFRISQPESMTTHLRAIDSYLFRTMPAGQKVLEFGKRLAYGVSPTYWFIPNAKDLARHIMKGYGHLNIWLLPFLVVGVGLSLWRVRRSPAHRAVLLAGLATPVGAALADVTITRVMAFVPVACVLIGLGLDAALELLNRRTRVAYWITAVSLFVVLSFASLWMLRDALTKGPLWYSDYGLYGMQYGAHQLFEEAIPDLLKQDPNAQVMMTSTWANGADTFIRFFMPREQQGRVMMLNVDYFMQGRRELTPDMVLVMTPNEYERAQASGKFKPIEIERIVPYPDGTPGFYFGRLAYEGDLEQILTQEREERSRPVEGGVDIGGQSVQITHSQLDMGQPSDLFDGDTFTLVRGLEANPLVFEFTFPEPRPITGLGADFASMDFTLTAKLFADENSEPKVYSETFRGLPPDPHVDMAFDGAPPLVKKIQLEAEQLNPGNEVHIHVRELEFRE
jgi:4-amino-4-deoxy-L-arabinose transferase-like glycosyltransferase/predicted DNA-binding antitoxin AbrB/MazE fold protein